MTDVRVLLERHKPRLVYDSHEAYFADSAAIWTDSPHERAQARGRNRPRQAAEARARLPRPDGLRRQHAGAETDAIGDTTRDYAANAAALHEQAKYANRVHGHARKDAQGRLWLQYWLFYYYNDYQLLGPLSGGNHEGDWELVQLRLDAAEQPEQIVFSQHKQAESKAWKDAPKAGNDAARLRRARLARQLLRQGLALDGQLVRPGRRQGPADHARARGARGPDARVGAVARVLGRHQAAASCRWTPRARSARACARTGWTRPSSTGAGAQAAARPPPPAAAARDRAAHAARPSSCAYDAPPEATALAVALRPKGSDEPARHRAPSRSTRPRGEVELPADDRDYDVWTSVVGAGRCGLRRRQGPVTRHRQPVRVASPPRGGRRDHRGDRHLQRP